MKNKDYLMPDLKLEKKRSLKKDNATNYRDFQMSLEANRLGQDKKYFVKTYGCQANVRDGESLSGMLEMMGFTYAEVPEKANVILFNTCAIRRAAEEKVIAEIGNLKYLKREKPDTIFALCGCMAQEKDVVEELLQKHPQIDLIFGTHNLYRFPSLLQEVMLKKIQKVEVYSQEGEVVEALPVKRSMSAKGFVNIMYGCDKFCTYCIVPYTRGKERSRRMKDILDEVLDLKQSGRKEVVLLGQNVNAYGKDLHMEDGFTDLLRAVSDTGIERIRFYTSHPRDYHSSLIDLMAERKNIMPFLHFPVQSGSNDVLRRMARGYTVEHYISLYNEMIQKVPNITFTTDIIVGFPGESEADFEKTMSLVEHCQYDMAYTFLYSARLGTPAASMPDFISKEVKKERLQRLNQRLRDIAAEKNKTYLHKVVKVLCEGASKKNNEMYAGYTEDNKLVNFSCSWNCLDEIVDVEITETHSYTLNGRVLEK
ncbi:tRNA (N6-isopentenyl adenosine(37)-C2)-methylthiotransferase MiaB [Bulleidia sp. zg-1006]|uniref:tRNA (N6-isopentenyl adenosine(37)-C2)-methylthiotransferase MiaB n=1 Tax=Bulleidia sp. zg-1006 TaxID=2806552 RepID=UPI00193A2DA0|nr:tRNA (N6-isopentenyl adenosine(37)-C2)-methylthiotransferase MiaB [Bulleidia sp. zg-1006]QRG87119.1 tRNA (N6-isopentenyl adenosine(37)-C2)-methylthiotransferase MiaB [Bulleidia sp. zg-1006]